MTASNSTNSPTLASSLTYTPRPLSFGTSGRRGDVVDLTQLEIYINARAELDYLQSLSVTEGGIRRGEDFYYAHDLRPSSTCFVAEQGGRGELAQAIEQAIRDAGMTPINLGPIPTPALSAYALARGKGGMMVTGSHIPFHRNGYKTNSAIGELLKSDETPIARYVEQWRTRVYSQPAEQSMFDERGCFKAGSRPCGPIDDSARREYLERYVCFLGASALTGIRVLVYQHSAVGRDLLVEGLRAIGAEALPVGRSDTFVPIDTEAIDDTTLEQIRVLAEQAGGDDNRFHAMVSTDGDSDRPLLIGLSYGANGRCIAKFFGGDVVGMLVAAQLHPDAVVVPISCNDAIDRSALAPLLFPKTRIGSPFVIAGMNAACQQGARRICGWEANGGFLTGSSFCLTHQPLPALPTRDAFLPIMMVLAQMAATGQAMEALFATLPRRYSRAGLLRNCPLTVSQRIVASFASSNGEFLSPALIQHVAHYFGPDAGFGELDRVDYTDGIRMYFNNCDVAHLRPSGNADELRIYAVADSQQRADDIVEAAIIAPNGILHRLRDAL